MLKLRLFKRILFSIFSPIIWIFRPRFKDFSTLPEASIKRRRIAVFIVLCFFHVLIQLGAIEQLWYDENSVTKDMDLLFVRIVTFPMYPNTEKIYRYDKTGLGRLPYIDYIFMSLNGIFWVGLFFFTAGEIAALRNRYYLIPNKQKDKKESASVL